VVGVLEFFLGDKVMLVWLALAVVVGVIIGALLVYVYVAISFGQLWK
jgi:hypothetical protein